MFRCALQMSFVDSFLFQCQPKITEHHIFRKTRLITPDDLTIDWRIFYGWIQLICENHDLVVYASVLYTSRQRLRKQFSMNFVHECVLWNGALLIPSIYSNISFSSKFVQSRIHFLSSRCVTLDYGYPSFSVYGKAYTIIQRGN